MSQVTFDRALLRIQDFFGRPAAEILSGWIKLSGWIVVWGVNKFLCIDEALNACKLAYRV